MKLPGLSWIQQLKVRWTMRKSSGGMSSMTRLSTGGGIPVRQVELAPQGLEFLENVSEARWVEEGLSEFGKSACARPGAISGLRTRVSSGVSRHRAAGPMVYGGLMDRANRSSPDAV